MLRQLFDKLYAFGVRVANIGVHHDLSFHEKKKTQVINLCVSFGLLPKTFFTIQNIVGEKYLLVFFNFIMIFGGIAILIMNNYRKYRTARLIVIIAGCLFFGLSAIFYRNGGEYFLLANLIIIVIFFTETRYLVVTSFINCVFFIGIKIYQHNSSFVYDTVPFNRILFNISWALALVTIALWFFKTEQLAYLKEIEAKNNELLKINQTKEKLFSIIAHDLRSPIGQLKGSLELVNNDYISPEKFSEMAAKISENVDQLHSTLDNLLRWSLSQLQGITANPERTELAPILEEKHKILQQKLEEKNIRLAIGDITQAVWADPDHLRLILRNLLSNAVKYSHPDSVITVTANMDAACHEVTILIRDHGTGMTDAVKTSIFHSDTIYSKPGTANEKGTGLGLKLCREFIEKNKGRIYVESEENKGSCFYICLPAAC